MHSRPPEGPHCSCVAVWTLAPGLIPVPSQVGAEPSRCCGGGGGGGGRTFGQSAGAIVGEEGRMDRPYGRGKNTETSHFK